MGCTKPCFHPLPFTPTHSHLLPPTPTNFNSFLTYSHSFLEHSHQHWLISAHIHSLTPISSVYCVSVCLTYLSNLRGVILNRANTHSHSLSSTCTHFHLFTAHSHLFQLFFSPPSLMFRPLLLILNPYATSLTHF